MNIFYLDKDPVKAAEMSCDKHVVKMILESAQMLCTAKRVLDGIEWTDYTKNGRKIKRWRLENSNLEQIVYKPEMLKQNLMFGTPDEVIEKLKLYEALGVDEFIYYATFGLGHKEQKRSLDLFINKVMPEFLS